MKNNKRHTTPQSLNSAIKNICDIKVGKKTPLALVHFEEFFRLLPSRADSERSWTVTRKEIEAKNFDLKAVNPNRKNGEDTRAPVELIALIRAKGREVEEALAVLSGQGPGEMMTERKHAQQQHAADVPLRGLPLNRSVIRSFF